MNLPGGLELVVILVIVLLLFGVGRISRLGGELGEAIGNFRQGMKSTQNEDETAKSEEA